MYTDKNYKTKSDLKRAVAGGTQVRVWQRNGDLHETPEQHSDYCGRAFLEGPHYPQLHRWHATATIENGIITKVK